MDPATAVLQSGGIATYRELREVLTRSEIDRALAANLLLRVRRGHYGLPSIDEHRRAALALSGVLGGTAAALHWGWKVKFPPEIPDVIVARRRHPSKERCRGVALRWADLATDDVRNGVLSPVATALDCARRLPLDQAVSVVDSALRAGVPKTNLLLAAQRLPRTGRSRALEVIEFADARADNPFESVLRVILADVACIELEPQQWIGNIGRADLVDMKRKVVIEADSLEFHSEREAFLRDMVRYNAFVGEGYLVLRFGWDHVMFEPNYVREAVIAAVRAHGR